MQKQLLWWTSVLTILSRPQCSRQVRDLPPVRDWRRAFHCGLLILAFAVTTSCQSGNDDRSVQAGAAASQPGPAMPAAGNAAGVPTQQPTAGSADSPQAAFPYALTAEYGPAAYGKLSGIVYYPPHQSLMAVSDDGHISELTTTGILQRRQQTQPDADFEGITYHPGNGLLYIAVEGVEIILEVNPATLLTQREIPINRTVDGNILLAPAGDGIEGIAFVPAADDATQGSFYLVNQSKTIDGPDPSVVFEVTLEETGNRPPQAQIMRYFTVGMTDLSAIEYAPAGRRLLIVSDANDRLLEVSLSGEVLASYVLSGKDQEGVAIDDLDTLYIAQDRKESLRIYTVP